MHKNKDHQGRRRTTQEEKVKLTIRRGVAWQQALGLRKPSGKTLRSIVADPMLPMKMYIITIRSTDMATKPGFPLLESLIANLVQMPQAPCMKDVTARMRHRSQERMK